MRFAQNTCSTRSGNSFHDEISSKTRSARNEFLKGKVYLLQRVISVMGVSHKHLNSSSKAQDGIFWAFFCFEQHINPPSFLSTSCQNFKHEKSYSYVLLTHFYKDDNEYEYEMDSFSYLYSLSMLTLSNEVQLRTPNNNMQVCMFVKNSFMHILTQFLCQTVHLPEFFNINPVQLLSRIVSISAPNLWTTNTRENF